MLVTVLFRILWLVVSSLKTGASDKEDDMGGACSKHETYRKWIQNICRQNKRLRYHLEDLGVYEKISEWGGKLWTGCI